LKGKQLRLARIRELLRGTDIQTHEELGAALERHGIGVSQATLSKDLRELGVVRMPRPEGGFRYALPELGASLRDRHILEREVGDYLVRTDRAQNLVVLRTLAGHAQSLCAAIDRMGWPEIMGTIGGEDTILIVARAPQDATAVVQRIAQITGERTGC
jgi:transcriptional regulator of arginine metabolism